MNKKVGIIVGAVAVILIAIYIIITLNSNQKEVTGELEIKHELGTTYLDKNPEKVIVFDFGVLDALDRLGVDVIGLPKSSALPTYLSKFNDDKYHNVGTLQEPNFEAIYELNPDLIIISTRQRTLYGKFVEIAPTIYMGIDTTKYLSSFKANMQLLGKIFAKEEVVETELTAIENKITSLNALASESKYKTLILMIVADTLTAFGEGSRFGIIHNEFGFEAVDKNIKVTTHGDQVDYEFIKEKNPDVFFIIDRNTVVQSDVAVPDDIIDNEIVNSTNAGKNSRIYYLNPEVWYLSSGGLTSTNMMIDEVLNIFN